ncbi:MAG: hypothetical protein JO294_03565 [Alphaproteobacteria bacterium]|nr:hypothetical protein [Alphaproteobacteria bacterium]
MKAAWALACALMLPGTAFAADCDAEMPAAHQRIADIKARDPKIDALLKKKDLKGVCAILKTNVADMTFARDAMQHCMTGFEKNENVAALNANLTELTAAIAMQCR